MFISATILYFGETPVGYDLYKVAGGFVFKPAATTSSGFQPPEIIVRTLDEDQEIEGVQNEDLHQQIMRLVELHNVIDLEGKLSAAS